jgi:3',5'-cyclic-AMP phosphodiesterase
VQLGDGGGVLTQAEFNALHHENFPVGFQCHQKNMPLHLPPISRREFLKRAALAGAGLALVPGASAALAGKPRDEHFFALFSDAHIAADAATISRTVNMAEQLAAAARELIAWPQLPATLIVNGDLALSTGLPGEYATFSGLIDPIRASDVPIHLSLGNHDQRDNFWKAFPKEAAAQPPVAGRQVAFLPAARANWFLLDSLDVTNGTPGELGAAQLAWLAQQLAAHRDKPAIIIGHHNLTHPGWTAGLKDSAAFAGLFEQHRHVKAYIFGHTHDWSIEQHASGVHLINLPPTGYVFKTGRPSGWVRTLLAVDSMEIELRSLDPKHPEHGKVQQLKWREG